MNSFSRGVRNAFRNGIRTVSVVLILALAIGLALAMLVARQAVNSKITDVKASIGNAISISPAGMRGFGGGGFGGDFGGGGPGGSTSGSSSTSSAPTQTYLTSDDFAKVKAVAHITSVSATMTARATSGTDTNLTSPMNATIQQMRQQYESNNSSSSSSTSSSSDSSTSTFQMPISITGTTDVNSAMSSLGSDVKLSSGATIDGSSSDDVAIVGDQMATQNNLKVGSTFTLYNTTITVKGIITSPSDTTSSSSSSSNASRGMGRNLSVGSAVIMPLATVQKLSGQSGNISSMTATVDTVGNTSAAVAAITNALGNDSSGNARADVTSDESSAQTTLDSLNSIKTTSTISLIACGVAAAVIIFLAMLMIVRERRNEIGVLKAIGAKGKTIVMQFIAESLVLTVLAAVIGLGIGILAATPLTNTLVSSANSSSSSSSTDNGVPTPPTGTTSSSNSTASRPNFTGNFANRTMQRFGTVTANVNWTIVLWALGSAVIIAAIGATAASLIAMRVRPAEAVRAE